MRLAILISLAAIGCGGVRAAFGDALVPCEVGLHGGYLVPVAYADAHRTDILATLPEEPNVDNFWKVSEQIAIVADRILHEKLEDAAKDPTLIFPDLTPGTDASQADSVGYQKEELKLILEHYDVYHRQYAGLMIEGHQVVLVNYAVGLDADPAVQYLFIHRFFVPHRSHFIQCLFDWDDKSVESLHFYGPWQDSR